MLTLIHILKQSGFKTAFLFAAFIICHTISFAQVGIGTVTPGAKLQVNNSGNLRPALRLFDSLANSGYPDIQFQNAGGTKFWQIGGNINDGAATSSYFDIYSSQAAIYLLTVRGDGNVGIGNSSPASKLDVAGDINLTGVLKVGGSSGTARQVLTSNGAGQPVWRSTAFSNNTRFSTLVSAFNQGSGYLPFAVRYNTNPANITIGATQITILLAGLYHFEGTVTAYVTSAAPYFGFSLSTETGGYEQSRPHVIKDQLNGTWVETIQFSIDLYMAAGHTMTLPFTLTGAGTKSVEGYFTGYLISE